MQRVRLTREVDALVLLEFVDDPLDERVVPVVTAELGVAIGGKHFEHSIADFEHRDVEGTTAKVIDGDFFVGLFIESVGERRGSRLVDDAEHFESGDFTGCLGGIALRVVEISRHGDHRLLDRFTEFRFRIGFQFAEDHRGDFLWGKSFRFAGDFDCDVRVAIRGGHDLVGHALVGFGQLGELATDQTLGGEDRVLGIGHGLALGGLADEAFAALGEGDDRWGGACTFRVFKHGRLTALHDGHAGVGGAEVDSEDFGHEVVFLSNLPVRALWFGPAFASIVPALGNFA